MSSSYGREGGVSPTKRLLSPTCGRAGRAGRARGAGGRGSTTFPGAVEDRLARAPAARARRLRRLEVAQVQ